MFRKSVLAGFVAAITMSVALGEEFRANIVKIEDGKVTFYKFPIVDPETKKRKPEPPKFITLSTAKEVQVFKAKGFKGDKLEPEHKLPGGLDDTVLKEELKKVEFKGIGVKKAVVSYIITDDSNKHIKEIRILVREYEAPPKKEGL